MALPVYAVMCIGVLDTVVSAIGFDGLTFVSFFFAFNPAVGFGLTVTSLVIAGSTADVGGDAVSSQHGS